MADPDAQVIILERLVVVEEGVNVLLYVQTPNPTVYISDSMMRLLLVLILVFIL